MYEGYSDNYTFDFELHILYNTPPTLTPLQYLSPKSTREILKLLSRAVIWVKSSMGRERAGVPDNSKAQFAPCGSGDNYLQGDIVVVEVHICLQKLKLFMNSIEW